MTSLVYFPVSGDYRNVSDPDISGSTNVPEVEIISGFVTFTPRLPDGFMAYVNDYDVIPTINEVQRVSLGDAQTGTFTLTYAGQTTAPIAVNATAAAVKAALVALSNIGTNDVEVTGPAGGPYFVAFQGDLAGQNVSPMTADASSLEGPPPGVNIITTRAGVPATNEVQTVTISGNPTGGTFTITYAGQTTTGIAYNASAATVQAALQALVNIGANNCSVTGSAGGPYAVTFVGKLGGKNIWQMTGSPTGLTVNEVQTITIASGTGNYTLSYSGSTTGNIAHTATAATVQTALQNLLSIGVGSIAVTGNAGGPYTVTFQGGLSNTNVPQITANSSGPVVNISTTTVGGSAVNVLVTTTTIGVKSVNETQTITLQDAIGGTFTLTFNGQTTPSIPYNASVATVRSTLEGLSSIGVGDIVVSGIAGTYTVAFQGSMAGTNLPTITANSALLLGADASVGVYTVTPGVTGQLRDAAIAIPPRHARIWEGVLSTINVKDTAGIELVANIPELGLEGRGFEDLIYDVDFSDVVYAEKSQTIANFAFIAPVDGTPVNITDPDLPRQPYLGRAQVNNITGIERSFVPDGVTLDDDGNVQFTVNGLPLGDPIPLELNYIDAIDGGTPTTASGGVVDGGGV